MSGVFFSMGLVSMLTACGLLNGKKWSWTIALILALISVVRTIATFVFSPTANTVTQEVFGLVLSLVILYYLYRPPVMEYSNGVEIKAHPRRILAPCLLTVRKVHLLD